MKKINEMFFSTIGERGITQSSANYLANIATEENQRLENELNGMSFVNVEMSIVGNKDKILSHSGFDDARLMLISKKLETIANNTAFIAYIREAIKAKEDELKLAENYSFERYLVDKMIVLPEFPKAPVCPDKPEALTVADVTESMSKAERIEYITKEAIAATYGKYIHNDAVINNARDEMHFRISNPVVASGDGRDTIVRYYSVSTSSKKLVDDMFMSLQNTYRTSEKALNGMKYTIKEQLKAMRIGQEQAYRELIDKYHEEYDVYSRECEKINAQIMATKSEYEAYRVSLVNEVSKLKIRIPVSLTGTFNYLDSLGKEEEK